MDIGKPMQLTDIIVRWHNGDKQAEGLLFHYAYEQLKSIAHKERVRALDKFGDNAEHHEQEVNNTTALIHDAYVKLSQHDVSYLQNRKQFFLLVSKVVRQILIDQSRKRLAQKRQPTTATTRDQQNFDQLMSFDSALGELKKRFPRQSEVLQLRYFAGLKNKEISDMLQCSPSLIEKDLKFSRSWMQSQI
jgi:RNA polymerase sigma factor (TIGR02999 family)